MTLGYVLVTAVPGSDVAVVQALQKVPEITELVPLFGEYDVIAKVDAPDLETLGKVILGSIRSIPGVAATKTLTATKL